MVAEARVVEKNLFAPPGDGLYIPDHVRCLLHEGGAIVADYEQGRYEALYEGGSNVLQVLNEQGSVGALAHFLEVKIHMDSERALRVAEDWVNTLMAPGYIMQHERRRPRPRKLPVADPWPEDAFSRTDLRRYTWEQVENLNLSSEENEIATESLSLAIALLKDYSITFGAKLRKLSQLQSLASRPATERELLRTLASIHYVSGDHMERIACLEVTTAAFIANARLGRKAVLSFGACVDAFAAHAWLATLEDKPVRLAFDEVVEGVYYTLLRHT